MFLIQYTVYKNCQFDYYFIMRLLLLLLKYMVQDQVSTNPLVPIYSGRTQTKIDIECSLQHQSSFISLWNLSNNFHMPKISACCWPNLVTQQRASILSVVFQDIGILYTVPVLIHPLNIYVLFQVSHPQLFFSIFPFLMLSTPFCIIIQLFTRKFGQI